MRSTTGHHVYVTKADFEPESERSLYEHIHDLMISDTSTNLHYDGVTMPMVSLDMENDISWLTGLSTTDASGDPAVLTQAVQQTKLRMNERGARVQSAAAVAGVRGTPPQPKPTYVMDEPFFIWVRQEGIPFPVFTGYITSESWKDPVCLDDPL